MIGGIEQASVPRYILRTHLPVEGLNMDLESMKNGRIFIQATTL
jgi:hypothetical protein